MNAFIQPTNFKLSRVFTWGVEHNKFGDGYSLSLKLDAETRSAIEDLVTVHGTRSPIYGLQTLYLKFRSISGRQSTELLNQCSCYVNVHFQVVGVYARSEIKYLIFRVTGLGKAEESEEVPPPQDL